MVNLAPLRFEVCVDAVTGAVAALAAGADRIELCQGLSVGGTTPSAGSMQATLAAADIAVHVLIRPRAGDFCYDARELAVMRRDIELAGAWGAQGVVLGVLRPDGLVDVEACARLIEASRPMSVTFHRAFDVAAGAADALDALVDLGVDRVLTSGQAPTAHAGRHLLRQLVDRAAERLGILAGGGVREDNVAELVRDSGVRELHFSARRRLASAMPPRGGVAMGRDAEADTTREETDPDRVRRIIAAAGGA